MRSELTAALFESVDLNVICLDQSVKARLGVADTRPARPVVERERAIHATAKRVHEGRRRDPPARLWSLMENRSSVTKTSFDLVE